MWLFTICRYNHFYIFLAYKPTLMHQFIAQASNDMVPQVENPLPTDPMHCHMLFTCSVFTCHWKL